MLLSTDPFTTLQPMNLLYYSCVQNVHFWLYVCQQKETGSEVLLAITFGSVSQSVAGTRAGWREVIHK